MNEINYFLILLSGFVATSSPGPATLAIISTAMSQGRTQGLFIALGVLTGSIIWSSSAAFGLATLLLLNAWLFEVLRYFGALYLLLLAYKSLRSAIGKSKTKLTKYRASSCGGNYAKGLLIHLTNPKAILFFGALYTLGVPTDTQPMELLSVVLVVGILSATIFLGYALLFSSKVAINIYLKLKPAFEGIFALLFGTASIKLLVTDMTK